MTSQSAWRRVAAACACLVFFSAAAEAADGTATVIQQRGWGAIAFLATTDATGCVSTTVFVVANDDSERIASGVTVRAAQVALVISQVDLCNVTPLLTGNGAIDGAMILVAPNLEHALVSAVVPVLNVANGTLVHVSVDLTFDATSRIYAEALEELNPYIPGYRINTTFRHTYRAASATGRIATDADELIVGSSVEAVIQKVGVGTVVILDE